MHPNKSVCVGTLPARIVVLREINTNSVSSNSNIRVSTPEVPMILPKKRKYLPPVGECSDENVEQLEVSPALTNVVILDRIFDLLTTKDLRNCRLVCTDWAEVAAVALIKSRVYISNATLLRQTSYTQAENIGSQNDENTVQVPRLLVVPPLSTSTRVALNFMELKECMENSRKFPAIGIHLTNQTWRLSNPVVKQFLRQHGAKIRFLKLSYNFQSARALSDLLVKHLPNLEEVHIEFLGNFARDQNSEQFLGHSGQPIELPALKVISILRMQWYPFGRIPKAVCAELLLAANNLKHIYHFHPTLTAAVVQANKMHAISSLQFLPSASNVENLREFAQAKPNLQRIEIIEGEYLMTSKTQTKQTMSHALSNILESSKESLQLLKTNNLRVLTGTRFPVFSNLTTLVVVYDERLCRRFGSLPVEQDLHFFGIFPDHISLSASFPRLRKVRLELINWNERNAFEFPGSVPRDVVPTVEVLEYSCSFDLRGMEILQRCFPNVNHLVINWSLCFPDGNPRALWNVPFRLKKLEICSMSFIWDKGPFSGNAMDSFFTGIPEGICKNLRMTDWTHFTNPSILRTDRSLVCFKHLMELKISFSYEGLLGLRLLGKCPLISQVTEMFAFRMIPSLKVLFLFDFNHPLRHEMEAALCPLSPFVTFIHAADGRF